MWTAALQVFAAAAMGMALELCGPRLLAPAFGNGTIVWSAILAATLGSIGAGNLVGGRLADLRPWRGPARAALLLGALASALTASLAGPVSLSLSQAFEPHPYPQLAALLLASVALFGPPAALLAAAYPLAFRGALTGLDSAGRTAGLLYAASAVGSLVGALAPPLWGVSLLGARGTLWAFAALPALAATGWPALATAALLLLGAGRTEPLPPGTLERWESALASYSLEGAGSTVRLRADIPGRPVLSTVPPDPSGGSYFDEMVLARAMADEAPPSRVLLLGLGGGTVARLSRDAWPEAEIHAVELDPTLVEHTRERFGLDGLGITVHLGDGRAWLRRLPGPWDVVLVDVSVGFTPPPHLSSREFLEEVRARLAPRGVAAVYAPPPLNLPILGTLRAVFPETVMLDHVAVGSALRLEPGRAQALAERLGWTMDGPLAARLHHPPGGAPLSDDSGDFPWWWGMRIEEGPTGRGPAPGLLR